MEAEIYRLSDYERKPDKREPSKSSTVVTIPKKDYKLDDSELIPASMLKGIV